MILDYHAQLAGRVREAVRQAFDTNMDQVSFQYPPKAELGDLASAAPFELAKALRRSPRDIAQRLASELASAPGVRKADVAGGGYVNLFLDRAEFAERLIQALRRPAVLPPRPGIVIVEHTSINPNKAAHIGHLRNAVLGDTFVRVLRSRGHHVVVQNYIDDTGVQVADVVVGFLYLEKETRAEVASITDRFDYYCWDLYARVGEFYAADPANKRFQVEVLHEIEKGDNEIAALGADVATRIVECHLRTMARLDIHYDLLAHESDILRLQFWNSAFERLKAAGAIRFETEGKAKGCWVLVMQPKDDATAARATSPAKRDSLPRSRNLDDARGRGRTSSALEEGGSNEEGGFNDEDKVLVRSNGTLTYTAKDIAYQLWKFGLLGSDFRYRRKATNGAALWTTSSTNGETGAPTFGQARDVYNVIDVGQSYPQRVVKAGVAAAGHAAAARHSHHLSYEKVVLSPGTARALGYDVTEDLAAVKVSGRMGLGVKADDLIDALERKALTEIEARDDEGRDAAEKKRSAQAIATGALRYFLLKYGRTKVIVFDMDEALAFTGETGPYLQNSVVRARGILARLEAAGHPLAELQRGAEGVDWSDFLGSAEGNEVWDLFALMARTDEVCEQVVRSQEVALLARHAFAIAQTFHGYYQDPAHTVLHASSDTLRVARANVVDLFIREMEVILGLLGIPLPERM